ncbi:MAG: orotate phosphoribosyltransferase [Oscillospiraceae bacterium]|nr:orotate phosphoribosyltransferase [Oscillospiraceae bacterium]
MNTTDLARRVAADLLQIRAVFLRPEEPFTWASGLRSPIYCDNRLTYSDVRVRKDVEEGFVEVIRAKYPQAEMLVGTSTSGIGHAAICAWLMGLPTGYVRGGAKSHGRNNQIEGRVLPGQKVVVVEDLISTAGSVLEVVEVLRRAGAEVLGIVSIFTYGMQKGLDRLAAAQIENTSLSNFDTLVEVAAETGYLAPNAVAALKTFRDCPSDPGWMELL